MYVAVFDVTKSLPNKGIGQKVTRKTWKDQCFWVIDRVKTSLVRTISSF